MLALLLVVFLSVFLVLALVLAGTGMAGSQETKQTLAVLASSLAVEKPQKKAQIVDIRKKESYSTVPWMNSLLMKLELASRLNRLLSQANLKWTPGRLVLMSVAGFVLTLYIVNLRSNGMILSLLIGGLVGCAPLMYVLHKRKKRFNKFEKELPEALDMMVSALRVGQSLVSAFNLVATESPDPVSTEFRICCDEQNYGLEMRTALNNLTTRVPLQDLNMVTTAILIQKESGGNLAEVLDKVSYVIRERFRMKRQVMVHTAQGRLTGWILSFLPVVLGILLYMVNPETMSLLWKREIGVKLLYVAGGMTITGSLIIRKIVRMDV